MILRSLRHTPLRRHSLIFGDCLTPNKAAEFRKEATVVADD
jgi:hypothetical protein